MVQLLEYPIFVEEEAPPLDIEMPRVFRRPAAPASLRRGRAALRALLERVARAHAAGDAPGFGRAYGQLAAEFQPAIGWAHSCWEYLLSTQGCRFLLRPEHEKQYCRGDYKVFTESEFQSLVHRAFKETLLGWLESPARGRFELHVRESFWKVVDRGYRALEDPPDPNQRKLTGWSYLRCVPYEFLNPYHHNRVYEAVDRLPEELKRVVELYYLSFYREEAVLARAQISLHAFRRRRALALRQIAGADTLSAVLLQQIERY